MKEARSTDWLLESLAINEEIRENELAPDVDEGSKRVFSKIKESRAYFNVYLEGFITPFMIKIYLQS